MASETFNYKFFLSGNTVSYGNAQSMTIDEQGTLDSSSNIGETVVVNGYSATLLGTTANGVVVEMMGYQYLLSNSSYSNGSSISINSSDPYVYCFLEGTQIRTPNGDVAIETLKMGDQVLTHDGRTVDVKWMGYQTVRNHLATSAHYEPVKIAAGALGENVPEHDLYVTGAHALYLEGMLINASVLVNGDTITRVPLAQMPECFTYWHIETEQQEAIIANGLSAETFVDAPDRKSFDNYNEYVDFFGVERVIPKMDVPRATAVRHLPVSLKQHLGLKDVETDWQTLVDQQARLVIKQGNAA